MGVLCVIEYVHICVYSGLWVELIWMSYMSLTEGVYFSKEGSNVDVNRCRFLILLDICDIGM